MTTEVSAQSSETLSTSGQLLVKNLKLEAQLAALTAQLAGAERRCDIFAKRSAALEVQLAATKVELATAIESRPQGKVSTAPYETERWHESGLEIPRAWVLLAAGKLAPEQARECWLCGWPGVIGELRQCHAGARVYCCVHCVKAAHEAHLPLCRPGCAAQVATAPAWATAK